MATIRSPFESAALYFVLTLAPLVKAALRPEFSGVIYENKYLHAAIRRLAKPGMNCVDVGAHAGLFLRAFERASPGGKHCAIEPVAWKAALLRGKFPRAVIHQCALGKEPGEASFSEVLKRSGASGLTEFAAPRDRDMASRTYMIGVKTLDDLTLGGPQIGIVKIDVEGAESDVMIGASGLIARDRPAILFESGAPAKGASNAQGVFDLLANRFGYRVTTVRNFVFGNSKIDGPDAFNFVRQYPASAFNFVALPN